MRPAQQRAQQQQQPRQRPGQAQRQGRQGAALLQQRHPLLLPPLPAQLLAGKRAPLLRLLLLLLLRLMRLLRLLLLRLLRHGGGARGVLRPRGERRHARNGCL